MIEDRIKTLERNVEQLVAQTAGLPVRLASGGGGGGASAPEVPSTMYVIQPLGVITPLALGAANIFRVEGGSRFSVGERRAYNPFLYNLPPGHHTGVKTFTHPDDPTLDLYGIMGVDVLHLLMSLEGFERRKSLAVEDKAFPTVDDIKWLGTPC